jgi:hypothetical protein
MEKENKIDQLKSGIKANNGGFQVPENYFETFEDKLFQRLDLQAPSAPEKKIIPLRSWLFGGAAVAAILLVSLMLINPQTDTMIPSTTESTELNWDQFASFDESLIVQELASDEGETDDLAAEIDVLLEDGLSGDDLMEVLAEIQYN